VISVIRVLFDIICEGAAMGETSIEKIVAKTDETKKLRRTRAEVL